MHALITKHNSIVTITSKCRVVVIDHENETFNDALRPTKSNPKRLT